LRCLFPCVGPSYFFPLFVRMDVSGNRVDWLVATRKQQQLCIFFDAGRIVIGCVAVVTFSVWKSRWQSFHDESGRPNCVLVVLQYSFFVSKRMPTP
jgi:hypothetical protein